MISTDNQDYKLFHEFIKTYWKAGFKGINPDDPIIVQLEQLMEKNDQFFYIADLIQMQFLYTSSRSSQMIGVEPADLNPYHFMEVTHPNDIQRLSLGRAKVIKMGQELFIAKKGSAILSTNYRMRSPDGSYSDFLIQCYMYYAPIPKTVYFLKIHTNIDWCKKLKHGYHYYTGNDLSYFRYPDKELLQMGSVFTKREFEIIKLIESGMKTEQIAKELYLSPYTVHTHRGNILKKTHHSHISDLIYELKERGVI